MASDLGHMAGRCTSFLIEGTVAALAVAPRNDAECERRQPMGIKGQESKSRPTEDAVEVKVEVDLLTGAMRVDPSKLLRSKARSADGS